MRLLTSVLSATATFCFLALPALAAPYEEGTVLLRLRALSVLPTVDATVNIGGNLKISNSVIPEVDVTYFFSPHWSVEVIAGTTKHAIYYNQTTKLANVWLLPPTVTLQYHFDQVGPFQPYVGAGPNFTVFYDRSVGPLGKLRSTDNWGFALQAGTDVALGDSGFFLNFDVKKVFLSTQASFSGAAVTADVNINPWLVGTGIGVRF